MTSAFPAGAWHQRDNISIARAGERWELLPTMRSGLFGFIKTRFLGDRPVHPLEGKMARMWIKKRLVAVYPELRNNPRALEQAYRSLNLEARPGMRQNIPCFEITLPVADRE